MNKLYETNVQQYKSDVGLKTLIYGIDDGIYILKDKKEYKKEDVEFLMSSIIKGFPIPPIYAIRDNKTNFNIISGEDILLKIYQYYKGNNFNMHVNIEGKDTIVNIDYKTLPKNVKRKLDYIPITVIEIYICASEYIKKEYINRIKKLNNY